MRCTINNNGVIGLLDAPEGIRRDAQHWFGAKERDGVLIVPHRKIHALISYYRPKVDQRLSDWIDQQFTAKEVFKRVSPHLKSYRGGYEAVAVARAIGTRRHGLFCGMGGGKTTMACEIALQTGPTLLVVPPLVWDNAYVNDEPDKDGKPQGDLTRWYRKKLRWVEILGSRKQAERTGALRNPADIYAVSSHLLHVLKDELKDIPFATIIIDESAMIKDYNSSMAKAVEEIAPYAHFRFVLSADPSPNDIGDLWPQVNFVDPNIFNSAADFEADYGKRGRWKVEYKDPYKNAAALEKLKNSGLFTSIPQQVFWPNAPGFRIEKVMVSLNDAERAAYDAMRESMSLRLGGQTISDGSELERTMKLRELAGGFVYSNNRKAIPVEPGKPTTKQRALVHLLRNQCKGQQVIVWVHFRYEYDVVSKLLQKMGIKHGILRGRDRHSRQAMIDFAAGRIRVLVTHQRTASHGLRFHNCYNSIYLTLDYSNEAFYQSIGRIHRPPQTRQCRIWLIIAQKTVDEAICEVLEGKSEHRRMVAEALKPKEPIHVRPAATRQDHPKPGRGQSVVQDQHGRDRSNRSRAARRTDSRR